jgi:hypothetical protein
MRGPWRGQTRARCLVGASIFGSPERSNALLYGERLGEAFYWFVYLRARNHTAERTRATIETATSTLAAHPIAVPARRFR